MTQIQRFLPWIVVGVAGLILIVVAVPTKEADDQFQLTEFSKLPVVDGGRIKPLDSVARVSLMAVSGGRQEYKDEKGQTQPAIHWLLTVMTSGPIFQDAVAAGQKFPLDGEKAKVFRIDNDQLLQMLGLKRREGLRYSIDEFAAKTRELFEEAAKADDTDPKKRDAFQVKALELAQHLKLYLKLSHFEQMIALPPDREGGDWRPILGSGEAKTGAKLWASMLASRSEERRVG